MEWEQGDGRKVKDDRKEGKKNKHSSPGSASIT